MTYEHKIIIGFDEIKAIIFECNQCKCKTVIVPEELNTTPNSCPKGHSWDWNVITEYRDFGSPFVGFFKFFRFLREASLSERVGFKILFELDVPNA